MIAGKNYYIEGHKFCRTGFPVDWSTVVIKQEANIEIVSDDKDEIIGINIMLTEKVKIPIGQFLKSLKRFETDSYMVHI